MIRILMVCVFFNTLCFAQLPKWIQSNPCVNDLNQQIPAQTNELQFYEVDFTAGSPVFTQRDEGNTITSIYTSGITELVNAGLDANGNVSFYAFSESTTPFSASAVTDIQFVAFDPVTNHDEIFASIPGNPTNASSVRNIEILPKDGSPNFYYVIYKTACTNNQTPDEIRYVTVDMNSKTISASTLISSGTNNEGMGISKLDCSTNQHWLFFSKYHGGVFTVYRCSISGSGISAAAVATSFALSVPSYGQGDLEISPDGTKLAIATLAYNTTAQEDVLLFDLNNSTGALSNYRWINSPNDHIYSLEFSPDSQRLYLSQSGTSAISNAIFNIPVQGINYTVSPSTDQVNVSLSPGGISFEVGFDQKLYFNSSGSTDRLSFISNPNSNASGNIVAQTPANSYGVGMRSGNSFPDQIDGESVLTAGSVSLSASQDTICTGQSVVLNASGATSFAWSNNLSGNGASQTVSPTATTTYLVTGLGTCSTGEDSIQIVVGPNPVAQISGTQEICEGTSVVLSGSGGNTYFWNGASTPGQSSITLSPSTTSVYSLVVSNGTCLSQPVNWTVVVDPKPQLSIIGGPDFCEGETGVFVANTTSGTAPFSYNWSNGQVNDTTIFVPSQGQNLEVVVTDQLGCSDTSAIQLNVETVPEANFQLNEEGCAPVSISVENLSTNATEYTWLYGDGPNGATVNGNHTYNYPGTYTVGLIATNSIGCSDTFTVTNAIHVLDSPVASFTAFSTDISEPTNMVFQNNASNSDSCVFYFGDNTMYTGCDWDELTHQYQTEGTYTVTQIVVNGSGCVDSVQHILVLQSETILYVPNTFTPDGNENNNTFFVVFPENTILDSFKWLIFDRWGEIVFESSDPHQGWDGTYHDKLAQDGAYTWKLNVDDGRNGTKEYTGHVIVLK